MGAVFDTRQDGVSANSDAAAAAWRLAAKAKRRGDLGAMRRLDAIAREFDQVAQDFAAGRNDDVVRDRQPGRRGGRS
jgi:hypothetical protein